jgi:hypothetical protein
VAAQAIPLLVDVIQNPDSRQPGGSLIIILKLTSQIICTVLKHVQYKNRVIVEKTERQTIYTVLEMKIG